MGDRFLRFSRDGGPNDGAVAQWLDLATGEAVQLTITQFDEACPPRACPEAGVGAAAAGDLQLIDCGRVGTDRWFEARALESTTQLLPTATQDAVRALAEHVAGMAGGPVTGIRIVRARPPAPGAAIALGRAIAAGLRQSGIVPVRADLDLPPEIATALSRRHLAVLCYDEAGGASTTEWIRRVSSTSLRSHLVVDLRLPGLRTRHLADVVRSSHRARERAPVYGTGHRESQSAGGPVPDARIERAMAYLRRRRGAAGERWLRAAVESSRRRGDEETQAWVGCRLANQVIARDDWEGARRLLLDLIGRVTSWHARANVADLAGRVLLAAGDLARADGLLSALAAEAMVLGQPLPAALRLRQAQLRFWQGRFEEAADLASSPDLAGPEERAWRALNAWAGSEEEAGRSRGATLPDGLAASLWDPSGRLARACGAEALLARGQPDEALRALGPRPDRPTAARLEAALLDWLRSRCAPDSAASDAAEEFIRQSGARGITRWGLGRTGMHLLHAVPALLQIVHEAEDDIAVLSRGCAWIRTHAGAESAGIVTHDGGRVVVGEGFATADLASDLVREALQSERPHAVAQGTDVIVTAPVHCSGATIGLVIARGPASRAGTLAEAAAAVSSLGAPALRSRLDGLAQIEAGRSLAPEILGQSPAVRSLREAVARAAATSFPVLIEGESGTGKELVARAVHRLSARRDRRFSAINCAALTDDLIEAELFGHTRGAFTGAVGARTGLFEEAHGGTLFLDEVGELSARAQAKLLRVLQEREIRRLGENASRPVDVRVVAATNRPLGAAASTGLFRQDLRFRLAVVRLRLPPLRERLEDVPLLTQSFWRQLTAETGKRAVLSADALAALCRYSWPGNVRELQNAVAALVVLAPSRGRVHARHVCQVLSGDTGPSDAAGVPLDQARRTFERQVITAALVRHSGRRTEAARELGLSRQGLTRAIKRLGVVATPGAEGVA
jgi:DNA-binding NtrC family response regulator